MKLFRFFAVFSLIVGSLTGIAFGFLEFSTTQRPTALGTTHTGFLDASDLLDDDEDNYATADLSPDLTKIQTFRFQDLPTNTPTEIYIEVHYQRLSSSGVIGVQAVPNHTDQTYTTERMDSFCISNGGDAGVEYYNNTNLPNSTSFGIETFYIKDGDDDCVTDYFAIYDWNPDDFVVNLEVARGATQQDVKIYEVKAYVKYDSVTMSSLDSYTASASGQFVSLNLSGQTAFAGEDATCKLNVFERCTREGYANIDSSASIATINLEPNNTDNFTKDLGGGIYEAHGFSATSSSWFAEGVRVPYNPGFTCTYPIQTLCVENVFACNEEDPPICTWTDQNVLVNDWDEGASRIVDHTTEYDDPEPSDPLSWIVWKLKRTFWEFMTPDAQDSEYFFWSIKKQLEVRVPFAYVVPIFDISWSGTATSSALPSFAIILPRGDGTDFDEVDFSPPTFITSLFTQIRSFTKIIIWLYFLGYVLAASRRIF